MATPAPSSGPVLTSDTEKNHLGSLSILASLFFMWGFITVLNDILIPHLKSIFTLNYTQVMLVQFCFFTAYAVASIPSGALVTRIGYRAGIVIGLSVTGIGCVLFYPAAGMQSYGMFLGALFILACGITLLQVAANPYVTILGPRQTASSRLILTQAFNSLGTTVAPLLGAAFILSVALKSADELAKLGAADLATYRDAQARAVQTPYLVIAGVLFLLAIIFAVIHLPKIVPSAQTDEGGGSSQDHHDSAWGYRHLVLGAVAVLLYVGAEVAVGSFLVSYFAEPEIGGLTVSAAGRLVAFYWGGLMVGRFAGAYFTRVIAPNVCLIINSVAAIALLLITMFTTGPVAMWSILAIGLANSIMFPAIFTLAVDGLGKHTSEGSGILCAAIVGGALVPVAQGMLADRIGIHHAFAVSLICYAFVAYYGISGYRPKIAPQAA